MTKTCPKSGQQTMTHCLLKFYGNTATFSLWLLLHYNSRVVTETNSWNRDQRLYGPQSLKYLLFGSLQEEFANQCSTSLLWAIYFLMFCLPKIIFYETKTSRTYVRIYLPFKMCLFTFA